MTKCSRSLTLLLDMKQYFLSALLLAAANMGAVAQNFKDEGRIIPLIKSGEYSPQTFGASQMRWTCPEIEQVLEQLESMKNDDFKVYANKVKMSLNYMNQISLEVSLLWLKLSFR